MTPTPAATDLRSDTVTRPTPAMRRAIADAVVGDDVYGDDPTVRELEHRVAALAGMEDAVYVPSGTMGNQLAVRVHTSPGDEVLCDAHSHLFINEQGGIGALSGCLAHPMEWPRGVPDPAAITAAVRDASDDHVAKVALLCLENTHNRHGGSILPLERLEVVAGAGHACGLKVHLDGARLWNASVATGVPIRTWAQNVDTLMMCFSKALGAPVGSILVGREEAIRRARRIRKLWGGGMRQVGILAAACLHALDHHIERLADDHRRARQLAAGLAGLPGLRVAEPETNIVMIELADPALERDPLLAALHTRGVWMGPSGPRRIRAITHLDIDDAGVARSVAAFRDVLARPGSQGGGRHATVPRLTEPVSGSRMAEGEA